jgi:beta-N-acetylhexosaminidase
MLRSPKQMSELERMAGSVIVCGFQGLAPPPEVNEWLAAQTVAGLILFNRNVESIEQVASLIQSCHERSEAALPLLMSVDQEGGRVARLPAPVLSLPPMQALACAGDPALTRDAATVLGRQLRAIGFNLNFAPVLDVDTNEDNPVIGDRAFGRTPERVIQHALPFAEGLQLGGVLSCGKHFPGHGDTSLDSHLALPTLHHGLQRLEQVELRPFRAAVGMVPSLMTAHVVFESLDANVPATMSSKVLGQLLRREIGYDGAVFSDDLEMKAISERYAIEEAGVLAIAAGCDLLLVCSDLEAAAHLRENLVLEARRSPAFHARLEEARSRADALRARATALSPAASIENALHHPQARAVEARLAQLE